MRHLDYKTLCLSLLISYGCVWWVLSFLIRSMTGAPAPAGETQYSTALWVLIPVYLAVPPLLAGFMMARSARNRPMLHVLIAALAGAALYALQGNSAWLALVPLTLTGISAGVYLRIASRRA